MKPLLALLPLVLCSCAELHQSSFDRGFASAVARNDTQGVMRTCTPANAMIPIHGAPPIVYAARHGNEDMIDVLYGNGAALNVRGPEGQSLAYLAAVNGHDSTAIKLARLGAGSSSDVALGTTAHAERRRAVEAENRRARVARESSSSSRSTGLTGSQVGDRMWKDFLWNQGPPNQWYQQDVPRY